MYFLNKSYQARTLCLFILLMFLYSYPKSIYAKEDTSLEVRYFDALLTKESYLGIRILKGEIDDVTNYMYNGRDYYIAYFLKKDGRLIKYKYLNNGNIVFEDRLLYKNKSIVKVKTYVNNALVHFTILYGDDPLKIRKVFVKDMSYIISLFDKNKKLSKAKKYDSQNRLITYTLIDYDKNHNQQRLSYFDHRDKLLEYIVYTYKKAVKVRKSRYNKNNKLVSYTSYSYRFDMKLDEARHFNAFGKLLSFVSYNYDDYGSLRYKLYYDAWGRLIPR